MEYRRHLVRVETDTEVEFYCGRSVPVGSGAVLAGRTRGGVCPACAAAVAFARGD